MQNITEHTCRICLKNCEVMISLFDEVEDFQLKLSELLENFGDTKIDLNDTLPQYICDECTSELIISVRFREKYQKSQEILYTFLKEVTYEECYEEIDDPIEAVDDNNEAVDDNIEAVDDNIEAVDDNNEAVDDNNDSDKGKIIDTFSVTNITENELDEDYISNEDQEKSEENEKVVIENHEDYFECYYFTVDNDGSYGNNDVSQSGNETNDPELSRDNIILNGVKQFLPRKSGLHQRQVINFNCDSCGAGFTHLSNLRKHLETHGFEELYECALCLWPFSEYSNLEAHSLSVHSEIINKQTHQNKKDETNVQILNDKNEKYSEINSKVIGKPLIEIELNDVQNCVDTGKENKKNPCTFCEKSFPSKSALNNHIRTHTGNKPFNCSECSKSFTTQGGLVLHTRRHTGFRPFVCNVCNKGFVESSNLKVHMRIHTGEKPHKCTQCEKSFSRVFLLQIHQRTHTGEKPYNCPYCNKAFAQQCDLNTHKKIHTGERPHKCPHCSKGFIKNCALNIHLRKHRISLQQEKSKNKRQQKQYSLLRNSTNSKEKNSMNIDDPLDTTKNSLTKNNAQLILKPSLEDDIYLSDMKQ